MQARALQELKAINGGSFPTPNPNCTKSAANVLPPKKAEEPAAPRAAYTMEDALRSAEDTLEVPKKPIARSQWSVGGLSTRPVPSTGTTKIQGKVPSIFF